MSHSPALPVPLESKNLEALMLGQQCTEVRCHSVIRPQGSHAPVTTFTICIAALQGRGGVAAGCCWCCVCDLVLQEMNGEHRLVSVVQLLVLLWREPEASLLQGAVVTSQSKDTMGGMLHTAKQLERATSTTCYVSCTSCRTVLSTKINCSSREPADDASYQADCIGASTRLCCISGTGSVALCAWTKHHCRICT